MRKAGPAVLLLVVVLGVSFLALSRASRTNRSVAREVTNGAPEPAGSALGANSAFARSPVALESPRPDDVIEETAPTPAREPPAAAIGETPIEHFLHVRARDTGQELDPVLLRELLPVLRGSLHDTLHPGSEANALARAVGPSPVRIDEREGAWLSSRVFYAKSPGYAWGRIELEAAREEDTLLLDQAGALELVVLRRGEPWEPGAEIEVYASGSKSSRDLLLVELGSTRTIVIEDLPAGLLTARARSYGREVGMVEAEVNAGERAIATLELRLPSSAMVSCEGLLVLPREWGLMDFCLDFGLSSRGDKWGSSLSNGSVHLCRAEMTPSAEDRFRWSARLVQSARYMVGIHGIFVAELEIGPAGTNDARIEVPPPGNITLYCVDERTGLGVESETIRFAPCAPRVLGTQTLAARTGAACGTPWMFSVPQGELVLFTFPNLYESAARVLTVGPGDNEVLLRLRARAGGAAVFGKR